MLKVEAVPSQVGRMESKQTEEVTLHNNEKSKEYTVEYQVGHKATEETEKVTLRDHKVPIETEEVIENDVHTTTNLVENRVVKESSVDIRATVVPLPKEEENEHVTHHKVSDSKQFLSFKQFWDKVGHFSTHYQHTPPPKYKWLREDNSPAETYKSGIPKIINKIYIEKSGMFPAKEEMIQTGKMEEAHNSWPLHN